MAETQRSRALVLKRFPWRDYDSRVVLYTENYGKKILSARGTKKISSKLAPHLEPITQVELLILNGRQNDYVGSALMSEGFLNLKNNLNALYYAGAAINLFDSLVKENLSDPELFNFFNIWLLTLNKQAANLTRPRGERLYQHFVSRFLTLLGYEPNFNNCALCQQTLKPGGNYLSGPDRGLICPLCRQNSHFSGTLWPISDNVIKIMRLASKEDFLPALVIKSEDLKEWGQLNKIMLDFM
ncbi:MAG: DNA repair protein RecO [Patescibacteria group bacterium]|nr:DNA repair protein RecO [Patescibacteria group bacterium]MDD3434896.1 DNA repair protein RecO [Patescibacteria group bacterium]